MSIDSATAVPAACAEAGRAPPNAAAPSFRLSPRESPSKMERVDRRSEDAPVPESLSYFVPFLMYRVMAKGLRQATNDYARLDLSLQEARLLIVLHQHKTMNAGMLAEVTCIEPSALSHLLRRLTRRGLVARSRAPNDNRSVQVALTASGQAMARDCLRTSRTHEAVLLRRFSAAERKVIRELLNRMYANAEIWASDGDAFALTLDTVASRKRKRRPPAGARR